MLVLSLTTILVKFYMVAIMKKEIKCKKIKTKSLKLFKIGSTFANSIQTIVES